MKKIISVIIIAVMIASLIPAIVNADDDEIGNVIVPYIDGTGITIDGTLEQGEWSENDKIALNENNLYGWAAETYEGPIDYYYSWGDKGLYMAAVVYDDKIKSGLALDGVLSTRFQIALNPAGIICYPWAGLFFSVVPQADSNEVKLMRHNWASNDDGGYFVGTDSGFEGKYTLRTDGENVIGWNMECVIPWDMIASADREIDLDETDEIYLTNFDPKDENRNRAFCTAMICYVQCDSNDGSSTVATGRTSMAAASEWSIESYDVVLFFALPGETDRSTETEYFWEVDEDTEPETEEDNETDAETDAETDGETDVETVKDTEEVKDTTTTAPVNNDNNNNKGGLGTGAIVGIIVAAVAVVAAVVVAVVLGKKKKA